MTSPDATDPDRTGSSLRNLTDVLLPCLDAVAARSVAEVGASHGDFTRELLDWAGDAGARVIAVEPAPKPELVALAGERPELDLIRETSHVALHRIPPPDAVIVDGDHNYHTAGEDLRAIAERAPGAGMPLVILHDLGWPHGRRDSYYDPHRIPEEHRQPLAHEAYLHPRDPGVADGGFLVEWTAAREGGPRNGVLTAVEDFIDGRGEFHLAIVPAFFGLGLLWHRDAPWALAVGEVVERWDRDPLLERLEANRCSKLAEWARCSQRLAWAEREFAATAGSLAEERERRARQEELLRAMLDSRAFAVGERLSRLRRSGRPTFSRDQVRRALEEEAGDR